MKSDLDVVHRDWPKDRVPQTFVDPQLGKIPLRTRAFSVPAQAVNKFPAGTVVLQVPENSVWKDIFWAAQFVASATVGGRVITARILKDDNTEIWRTGELAATAGQSAGLRLCQTPLDSVGNGGPENTKLTATLPPVKFPSGWKLTIVDSSNIDAALDTITLKGTCEEFVLPKGLARDEIPMGLESGFLWDLAEPRKVA